MTETLQDRLRHGADNIHSIGPGRAAGLLAEAAEHAASIDVLVTSIEALRDMVLKEHAAAEQAEAARRAFLERAVCHPGPPLSEHEDYDPEAPLGELEAAVLERMDIELKHERDLREIQRVLEEAIGRTPDPARSAVQVARDAAEHISAARTYRANMENPPADLEAHERAYDDLLAWTRTMGLSPPAQPGDLGSVEHADGRTTLRLLVPTVRPEHFAGPFPAISGYVKRTREARAAVVDQALGMLGEGQRVAVHDEPERVDILFLDPGQNPPSGQTWAVYGPLSAEYREVIKASLDRERRGLLRPLTPREQDIHDRLVSVPRDYDGPKYAYRIDDRLIFSPASASEPEARRAVAILHARDTAPDVSPAVAAHMATLRANSADRSPGPHPKAAELQKLIDGLHRTMAEASAEHDGDDTTMRMYRPMMETRRSQSYRPGSPIRERAPADYHPAEYMTPEQEAEAAEQAERFQGLDDSDRG